MIFKTLRIQNFLSYRSSQTIELQGQGLVLIEGRNKDDPNTSSNGSGKSSIIDALIWCLYGSTLRGYEGDEVINKAASSMCQVDVQLIKGTALYYITRTRKPAQLEVIFDDPDAGVYTQHETRGTIKDTQEYLTREVLQMSLSTFLNVVVFGQTKQYRFALLTDLEQKALLEECLQLEAYVQAQQRTRTYVDQYQTKLRDTEMHLKFIQNSLQDHRKALAEAEEEAALFASKKASLVAQRGKIYLQAKKAFETLAAVEPAVLDHPRMQQASSMLSRSRQDIAKYDAEIAGATQRIQAIRSAPTTCASCGQTLPLSLSEEHRKAEIQKQEEVRGKAALLRKNEEAMETEYIKTVDAIQREYKEASEVYQEYCTEWQTLKNQMDLARTAYQAEKSRTNPYQKVLEAHRLAIQRDEQKQAKLTTKRDQLQRTLLYYEFLHTAFGAKGMRASLISVALPRLNALVATYIDELTDGNTEIVFSTQSLLKSGKTAERFSVQVKSKHGADTYMGHSAGEKAKIDLCIGLALQVFVSEMTGISTNLVFFDEVTESLDETAAEKVILLLSKVAATRDTVFCISHLDGFKAHFPGSLVVTKQNGESLIT